MAVDEDDPVKSLPDKRVRHVVAEIHEDRFSNGNGSWKAHIVFVESVVDHRHDQQQSVGTKSGLLGYVLHQQVVNINGQVMTVLLIAATGITIIAPRSAAARVSVQVI